jgi:hypothetical protein
MPYADPIKNKEYYDRHKRKYDAEWRKKNRDKWNEYQRKKAADRRKTDDFKEWLKKEIETLKDWYVESLLKRDGFSKEQIDNNPELLTIKKGIILIKRYGKQYKKY